MFRSPVASAVCLIRLAVIDLAVARLIRGGDVLRQKTDPKAHRISTRKQLAKQGRCNVVTMYHREMIAFNTLRAVIQVTANWAA